MNRISSDGEPSGPYASAELLAVVYDELRKLAARRLAGERPGQTLDATALVHEAYLRLVRNEEEPRWEGRGHFFAAAAEAIWRILVENARRRRARKHGGQLRRADADLNTVAAPAVRIDVLALNEALGRLAEGSPVRAELVKLRFFAGLTVPEAAEVLGISRPTAERYWPYARARLFVELGGEELPTDESGGISKNPQEI
jgi:RNA polymerase sigma factor (TIGR02999 family)